MVQWGTILHTWKGIQMCLSVFVPAGIWQQTNKKTKRQTNKSTRIAHVFYMCCGNHCESCNFFHMLERPHVPRRHCSWCRSNWLCQPRSLCVHFDFTRFTLTFTEKKASPLLNLIESGCLIISSPGFLLLSHSLVVESRAQNS